MFFSLASSPVTSPLTAFSLTASPLPPCDSPFPCFPSLFLYPPSTSSLHSSLALFGALLALTAFSLPLHLQAPSLILTLAALPPSLILSAYDLSPLPTILLLAPPILTSSHARPSSQPLVHQESTTLAILEGLGTEKEKT